MNLKLQDNVTCCKRTGALNVGLMKAYNGSSASIVYVGIFCLEDRLSDKQERSSL